MDENKNTTETVETQSNPAPAQSGVETIDPVAAARQQKRKAAARKRRRKKIIKWSVIAVILLAIAGGIWYGVYKLFLEPEPVPPPQTTYSYRGSFSSSVRGYGQVKANRTDSVSAPARGELLELLVTEGDNVYEGQPLFSMDDSALREQIAAVEKEIQTLENSKIGYNESIDGVVEQRTKVRETRARVYESLSGYDRQLADIREKLAVRDLEAPFNGKLLKVNVKEGDIVGEGDEIGTIVRDEMMRLRCYFSYAYENMISVGQTAAVSIPASMEMRSGKVVRIDKVRNVTTDGAVLFAAEVALDNPGALTEGMEAVFTVAAPDGTTITPAEPSKLEYSQTETLTAPAKGKILSLNMTPFAEYKQGERLYELSDDGYAADIRNIDETSATVREQVEGYDKQIEGFETQIENLRKQIGDADEEIEKKNLQIEELNTKFELFNGFAPMSGLVTAITAIPGQMLEEGTAILAISDTSAMSVEIQLDERDVGSVSVGTSVSLTQSTSEGDMYYWGIISSIALEGKYDWGYAYYPAVITIENGEGLRSNSSMFYQIVTSEAEDCVLVPVNAVKYTEIGACVFVKLQDGESAPADAPQLAEGVVPEGFYAVQVTTGMSDSSQVEITSGIDEGVELFLAEGIEGQNGMDDMIYGAW